ncbi:arsenate reductase family protein [uncultured Clostridium sp.]|uniref:arsenate reductase family protein n=1 Tax=uncultured Clostridium sp. TaxID=59620 RepID=UPI0028F0A6A4|nr:arsenate reductase family protein [uncultured Clostridium sp.]
MLLVQYPKCSTCKKALKFLKENDFEIEVRDIVNETPTREELLEWIDKSNLEFKKFFNTSGKVYKELNLKDKINSMTKEEAIELLSGNGMLIKRPILINEDLVIIGFKEYNYSKLK